MNRFRAIWNARFLPSVDGRLLILIAILSGAVVGLLIARILGL